MKIKHMLLSLLGAMLFIAYLGCGEGGNRLRVQNYDAGTLQKKGYAGLGYDLDDDPSKLEKDRYVSEFYRFDPSQPEGNRWERLEDFPNGGKVEPFSFVIDGKIYIGGGERFESSEIAKYSPETFCFDPSQPKGKRWKQVADFPDTLYEVVPFTIDNIGYVGLGGKKPNISTPNSKFYSFNSTNFMWSYSEENDLEEVKLRASAFVINRKAYVLGGENFGGYSNVTYRFDPSKNSIRWVKEEDPWPLGGRGELISFVINEVAYVGGGRDKINQFTDFYVFDPSKPVSEKWKRTDDLIIEKGLTLAGIQLSIDGKGYVAGLFNFKGNPINTYYIFDPSKPAGKKWEEGGTTPPTRLYCVCGVL